MPDFSPGSGGGVAPSLGGVTPAHAVGRRVGGSVPCRAPRPRTLHVGLAVLIITRTSRWTWRVQVCLARSDHQRVIRANEEDIPPMTQPLNLVIVHEIEGKGRNTIVFLADRLGRIVILFMGGG